MGYAAAVIVILALYLVAPTFLVIAGRIALAGATMLLAALLPVLFVRLTSIDSPAAGLITMLMLPLPMLVLILAAINRVTLRSSRGH